MPAKNYNEYMREYMLEKYHIQRNKIIDKLGGKCQICGSKERLELDHVNKDSKLFDVAKHWSEKRWKKEIKKCQLLCRKCHTLKSIKERGHKVAKGTHGTISSFRYCKCKLCREASNKYSRARKLRARYGYNMFIDKYGNIRFPRPIRRFPRYEGVAQLAEQETLTKNK